MDLYAKKPVPRIDKADYIIVFLSALGLLLHSFVKLKANRIAEGVSISLSGLTSQYTLVIFLFLPLLLVALTKVRLALFKYITILIVSLSICYVLQRISLYAYTVSESSQYARVTLSLGFWIYFLSSYLLYIKVSQNAKDRMAGKILVFVLFFAPIAICMAWGMFNYLSVIKEFTYNKNRFLLELGNHIEISFGSVFLAFLTGAPLAVFISTKRKLSKKVIHILGILQTIPSIALFGILMIPLAFLTNRFPILKHYGISGVGWTPAIIALYLYSLFPIIINVFEGMNSIPEEIIEAAKGMGMDKYQILFKIRIALSVPIILNGLRIAAVQSIGNTAVAALIGAGGLGLFIFQGLGDAATDMVLLGAIPTIVLASLTDSIMQTAVDLIKRRLAYDKI